MNLKQYITPQKLTPPKESKFNTNIELVQFSGSLRLDMGNLTQSGEVIERIWATAFKKLLPKHFSPKSVLILGFGAGSAAKLIHKKWPKAKITGIELDPEVIKIAKEHFGADEIPNLKIINSDALKFVHDLRPVTHDLVIVDCYLGDQFPQKLESLQFYKKLKKHSDHVLINRLFWGDYKEQALVFYEKLAKHFSASSTRTPSNFLIHLN